MEKACFIVFRPLTLVSIFVRDGEKHFLWRNLGFRLLYLLSNGTWKFTRSYYRKLFSNLSLIFFFSLSSPCLVLGVGVVVISSLLSFWGSKGSSSSFSLWHSCTVPAVRKHGPRLVEEIVTCRTSLLTKIHPRTIGILSQIHWKRYLIGHRSKRSRSQGSPSASATDESSGRVDYS